MLKIEMEIKRREFIRRHAAEMFARRDVTVDDAIKLAAEIYDFTGKFCVPSS
jgi:hypothetical protein